MSTLIRPVYSIDRNTSEIELYRGRIRAVEGDNEINGVGRAVLHFRPKMNLKFHADFSSADPGDAHLLLSAARTVQLQTDQGKTEALVSALSTASSEHGYSIGASFILNPQRFIFDTCPSVRIKRTIAHIVNFPDFIGPTDIAYEHRQGGFQKIGRVFLDSFEWRAELQELPHTRELINEMRNQGGFGITHAVEVCRRDGSEFSAEEAEKINQKIYLFLSFARGGWSAPILSVGYDSNNNAAHEEWSLRLTTLACTRFR
ncbi:MAG: hypothetical protein Q8M26_18540 [Pseudolabrys sp.]|nr:hypothetical protein [Pseudolabrys sp.]